MLLKPKMTMRRFERGCNQLQYTYIIWYNMYIIWMSMVYTIKGEKNQCVLAHETHELNAF